MTLCQVQRAQAHTRSCKHPTISKQALAQPTCKSKSSAYVSGSFEVVQVLVRRQKLAALDPAANGIPFNYERAQMLGQCSDLSGQWHAKRLVGSSGHPSPARPEDPFRYIRTWEPDVRFYVHAFSRIQKAAMVREGQFMCSPLCS